MREIRPYGSEGGAARKGRPYPYPGGIAAIPLRIPPIQARRPPVVAAQDGFDLLDVPRAESRDQGAMVGLGAGDVGLRRRAA